LVGNEIERFRVRTGNTYSWSLRLLCRVCIVAIGAIQKYRKDREDSGECYFKDVPPTLGEVTNPLLSGVTRDFIHVFLGVLIIVALL
jgi:hypothetical protein